MKRFISYILLTIALFNTTACLDKFPEDQIPVDKAITTVNEADQAVIGIYSAFLNPALYEIIGRCNFLF